MLQDIDHRLNELKLQKGDLPLLIEGTQGDLEEKKEMKTELEEKIKKLLKDRKMYEAEVLASQEQLKKYEDQLYQVKTNKEYDAISLEIDTKKMEIEGLENKIVRTLEEEETYKSEVKELSEEVSNLETQTEEYRKELEEILLLTKEEEDKLLVKRGKVTDQIDQRLLKQYERISKAKGGIAVAFIKKASCGGCFSSIPPQKIVEVRELNRLHTCENCGRILVWQES